MKQRDIALLMEAVAPVVVAAITKAMAPVLKRLEEAEGALAALPPAPVLPDAKSLVAEVIRTLPPSPTAEEIAAAMSPPPTAEEVAALIPPPEPAKSVTLDDIRPLVREAVSALPAVPTAEEVAAFIPAPRPGRDADPEAIKTAVADAVAALPKPPTAEEVAVLVAVPTAAEIAALIPPAAPGKDADPEATAALVAAEVEKAIAALPPAAPGRDADPETIRAMVAEAVEALPPAPAGKDASPEAIAQAVEGVLATWERPKDGKSVTLDQLQPAIDEAVAKRVAALPIPKDGVGLAGALIDRDGNLVLTMTDGTTKSLGLVIGQDGSPGFGLDDFEVVDGDETFTLRFVRGETVKEFALAKPTLADFYRGVWKEGAHKAGSVVTWGGSIWLAKRATEDRPESSDAWTLIVKKGRDGKDGEAPKGPAKVKL